MRKLLSVLAAVLVTSTIAYAANVPFWSSIVDPGNILGTINGLIQSINSSVGGLVADVPGPVASIGTTNEQTLASASIAGGTIGSVGQTLDIKCGGTTAANGNTKAAKLYFGGFSISTGNFTTSAENWELELVVTNGGTQPNVAGIGRGTQNTTVVAPVATSDLADNLSGAVLAKCTATQGTASAADVTLEDFVVQSVK
jgi:hypothetical protein